MSATIGAIARAWERVQVTTSPGVRSASGAWINKGEIAWYNSFLDAYAKPLELTGASQLIIGSVNIQGPVTVTGSVSISGPVTVTGSVTVSGSVSITNSSIAVTGSVAITNASIAITGSVSITNASIAVTGSVAITNSTINIATAGGTNIIIDKLVQGAYIPQARTLQLDITSFSADASTNANSRCSKFFSRGCRGFIVSFDYYVANNTGSDKNVTVGFSPYIGGSEIFTITDTVPNGTAAGWRTVTVNKDWNYDGLLIYLKGITQNVTYYGTTASGDINEVQSSDGVSWLISASANARPFRVTISGQTVGDIPISGTVNNVQIPNVSAGIANATGTINNGVTGTVIDYIYGSGKLSLTIGFSGFDSGSSIRFYFDIDGDASFYCQGNYLYEAQGQEDELVQNQLFGCIRYDTVAGRWAFFFRELSFRKYIRVRVLNAGAVPGTYYVAYTRELMK